MNNCDLAPIERAVEKQVGALKEQAKELKEKDEVIKKLEDRLKLERLINELGNENSMSNEDRSKL